MTLQEKTQQVLTLLQEIKQEVKSKDPNLYEQWKAGGFITQENQISMYPNLSQVSERLEDTEDEE